VRNPAETWIIFIAKIAWLCPTKNTSGWRRKLSLADKAWQKVGPCDRVLADEALQATDLAALDMQGHGFDGFAFERAQLTRQIMEKMLPGFSAHKTPLKDPMKGTKRVKKSLDIGRRQVKWGHDIRVALGAASG
jgi:hypothetical protein